MKGNKKAILVVVLLVLVGLTSAFVAYSYAKYTSTITGNQGTATVAKWAFETDNETQTIAVVFAQNYDTNTVYANRLAPGTEGSFNVVLSNAHSEVGVDWTVTLTSIDNLPTNLKFYKTRSGSAGAYTYSNELVPGDTTTTVTGNLVAGDDTGVTVPIYWAWAYETDTVAENDPYDTNDGEAGRTLTIGVTITGVQTRPTVTP